MARLIMLAAIALAYVALLPVTIALSLVGLAMDAWKGSQRPRLRARR